MSPFWVGAMLAVLAALYVGAIIDVRGGGYVLPSNTITDEP